MLLESDSLRVFLKQSVAGTSDITDLTVDELTKAYLKYCHDRNWRSLALKKAQSDLEVHMYELFAAEKSNSIMRGPDGNQTAHRGYRHVKWC